MQSQINNLNPGKAWYKRWWGIIILIALTFILILLIAFGFAVYSNVQKIKKGQATFVRIDTIASPEFIDQKYTSIIEGVGAYSLGPNNAKVIIVEFGDFACPLCQNSYTKIREISQKYKNDVKIIFRNFPVYEEAIPLAMAGQCAGEQGLFWLMYDKLYQNQGDINIDNIESLAEKIGADTDKFMNCLETNKYLDVIKKDYTDAETLNISGTPTWFINGYKIQGDMPYELFDKIIGDLVK